VVANEVEDEVKRGKKSCLLLKVDFEKAFNLMSWNFLLYMLQRLGFMRGGLNGTPPKNSNVTRDYA